MKLSLSFFVVGLLLMLLQTTFLHLLPLGPVVPDLILVLCVYWGLYHPTVGAALGSFLLGYSVDVVSSPILGLNAFAMSLVFLAVYLSSRSIWLHHPVVSSIVVLLASLVKGAALILVWTCVSKRRWLLDRCNSLHFDGSAGRGSAGAGCVRSVTARASLPGTDPRHSLRIKMALLTDINRQDGAPELRRRTRVLYLVLILVFGALLTRLFFLQLVDGERYTFLSENNRVRIKRIPGTRGMVFDRQADNYSSIAAPPLICCSLPKTPKNRRVRCVNWRATSGGTRRNCSPFSKRTKNDPPSRKSS